MAPEKVLLNTEDGGGEEPSRRRTAAPQAGLQEVLSSVSHDIRTPLAGLLALIQMMEAGTDGPLTQAQRERLARMQAAAAKLAAVADQVSELALLQKGKLPMAPVRVELADLALLAFQQVEQAARDRAVELRLEVPSELPSLSADGARVRQILTLLMTAVMKRSDGVVLTLGAEPHGSRVRITLRESARSIPVEALPSGFGSQPTGPFVRLDGGRLGDSLGVSIARGLIELHGGDLEVAPAPDDGLLASFDLPAELSSPAPHPERTKELRPAN
ncbi:MAG TPA: HAMP domain-containing sensor histidine kinase [Candidatus Polarisedimenticolia bacterium]|nr:HAMP domain-containing sensor histidine kinase [Candidatus Polarisedimenticolia bacterium]